MSGVIGRDEPAGSLWCRKELGHVVRREHSSAAARYGWLVGYLALMLAGGGLTATALLAAPQMAGPAMLATTSAALAFLGLQVAFDRREEIAADLFAVDLTRDLEAAAELMSFYEENVTKPPTSGGLGRAWAQFERRWFATHPAPQARLAAMRRHLVDQQTD
ncbi:hypothetical protein E2C04_00450 [Nocardioides daphniae]|uniref:Peptidase M48 domain-containing protein n=1 Tax=Nocardioides daphniae TaxID=402297 RepID=A0A4P7U745_9ACTN|nr:hypothetical protein E2C04_00450 [Nocardioides daphniae]